MFAVNQDSKTSSSIINILRSNNSGSYEVSKIGPTGPTGSYGPIYTAGTGLILNSNQFSIPTSYLASPPPIGSTTAANGNFTNLTSSSSYISHGQVSMKGLTGGSNLQLSGVGATGDPELKIYTNDIAGVINVNITNVGGSGTSAIVIQGNGSDLWTIDNLGNIFPKQGFSSMTNGFVCIPADNGVPTSIPTVNTVPGIAPLYYNTKDGALYAYNNTVPEWQSINFQPNQLEARANPQTISTLTDTVIEWPNVDINGTLLRYNYGTQPTGSWTNISSRTLTVVVSTTVGWDDVAGGARAVYITRNAGSTNGQARLAESDVDSGSADFDVQNISCSFALQPGQYFSVWVWQNSGQNVGIGNLSGGMETGYSVRLFATVL